MCNKLFLDFLKADCIFLKLLLNPACYLLVMFTITILSAAGFTNPFLVNFFISDRNTNLHMKPLFAAAAQNHLCRKILWHPAITIYFDYAFFSYSCLVVSPLLLQRERGKFLCYKTPFIIIGMMQ